MRSRLVVTDLLNQNAACTRTVNDLFVQGLATNALQRYARLVLTYTLRPAAR